MSVVYVLVSESTGRRYVGQTDDLARRLTEHNDPDHNRRKYTSRHAGPWIVVNSETHPTRVDAMQRERWFKSCAGRAWLDEHIGRASLLRADSPLRCRVESYLGNLAGYRLR